ncbi:MAG: HAMP domain-containing histidine kinase, partial [Lachnospiraceae bacterium]|nr:HAMP domain-containing histidine kinase [Lachnospiraceae bacterium]
LQALVGSVYRIAPEAANLILQEAFTKPVNTKNLNLGKQAAISMGYTEDAFQILRRDSVPMPYRIIYLLLTGLLLIGLILLQNYQHKNEKKYKKQLSTRIHQAHISGQEFTPKEDSGDWYSLESDIADVLKYNKNLQNYIQKREVQLQHFIENIAHQIKTPLAGMILNIENIKERITIEIESESTKEKEVFLLSDCVRLGEQIQYHIMCLLNLARMEAGKIHFRKDAVELLDLLESLQERYGKEHIILQTDDNGEIYITGDRDWLLEAMANMVENSLSHSDAPETVYIHITALKDMVKISIADQGKGMTSEELNRLFDRYDIGNSSRSFATGIGMNLARCVIQAHYSDIHVESEVGHGTKMEFRLPILHLKEKIMLV